MIVVCIIALATGPKPLQPDFTTEQLCDWALAMGNGQKMQFIMIAIISASLIGIYGRLRVKEHDDED